MAETISRPGRGARLARTPSRPAGTHGDGDPTGRRGPRARGLGLIGETCFAPSPPSSRLRQLARGDYQTAVATMREALAGAAGRPFDGCAAAVNRSATPWSDRRAGAPSGALPAGAPAQYADAEGGRLRSRGRPASCSGSPAADPTTLSGAARVRRASPPLRAWGSAVRRWAGQSRTWPRSTRLRRRAALEALRLVSAMHGPGWTFPTRPRDRGARRLQQRTTAAMNRRGDATRCRRLPRWSDRAELARCHARGCAWPRANPRRRTSSSSERAPTEA
jgi:hypothetical protein